MKYLFIFILTFISIALDGQVLFGPENEVIGHIPYSYISTATSGDIDNDGDIDFIAIMEENQIVLYKNIDGTGIFDEPITIGTDLEEAKSVVLSDLDGDNDLDIISNASDDNLIVWYENLGGNGTFGTANNYNITNFINLIHSADVDADGDMDLVFTSHQDNGIQWLENENGLGDFGNEQELILESTGATSLDFVDLDNDGDLDLYRTIYSTNQIVWHENNMGIFGNQNTIFELPHPSHLVFGDMDGDNDLDLVVSSELDAELVWFENEDNNGNFGDYNVISTETLSSHLAQLGDFDNDGDLDIIAFLYDWGKTKWFENLDGLGNFSEANNFFIATNSRVALMTEDINNDSFIDIVMGFNYSDFPRLIWLENLEGMDTFPYQHSVFKETAAPYEIEVADINGDNTQDIICSSIYDDKISWFNNENGLGNNFEQNIITVQTSSPEGISLGDLDGDGDLDILSASTGDNKIAWYENEDGIGNFGEQKIISVDLIEPTEILTDDIDGDGDLDIFSLSAMDNKIVWYKNENGTGEFWTTNIITNNSNKASRLLSLDIDLDGDIDLVASSSLSDTISWYSNEDGMGNFGEQRFITSDINSSLSSGGIGLSGGDLDGDGDIDLISSSGLDDKIAWYQNIDGLGDFSDQIIIHEGNDVNRVGDIDLVDIDTDGDLDILFCTVSGNSNSTLGAIEHIDGLGNFGPVQIIADDLFNAIKVASGDFDGDNNIDIVTTSSSSHEILWYKNLLNYPTISGTCFVDYNENKIKDSNEVGWFSQKVNLEPEAIGTFSGPDGEFRLIVENGNYLVSAIPEENWHLTTDAMSYDIEVQNDQPITNLDFGFAPNEIFSEITPNITASQTRCGFQIPFWIHYKNTGTTFDNGIISFQFDDLTSFVDAEIQPDSIENNTLFWEFGNIAPSQSDKFKITLQMPDVTFLGDTVYFESIAYISDSLGNTELSLIDNYQSVINCAYDPNDKIANPPGQFTENLTLFNEEFEYTIRFQNTGTDTAFTVRLEDQLDNDLDWSTFHPITASHPYQVTITDGGLVEFLFENILLPDSTTNEIASHGFAKYRINPLDNLEENTEIHNTANIFFDFNPPIQTNTTLNTMVSEITNLSEVLQPINIETLPNPFDDKVQFNIGELPFLGPVSLNIFDVNGRVLKQFSVVANSTIQFEGKSLASGIYFYQLEMNGINLQNGKFVKK